jgi:hypothetical protein
MLLPYRCRVGARSKVAGSLLGTRRAAARILSTFVRVAAQAYGETGRLR